MTAYSDLEGYIEKSTVLNDEDTVALINPAINFGIWLATLLFEPDVQKVVANQTAVSTVDYITISLTRPLRIDHIYNYTGDCPMWPMSYDQLRIAYVPSGNALYWAKYGNRLYYKPTPSSDQVMNIHFLQYPARITSGTSLPFEEHQDFVLNAAIQFIWASQEEIENVDMWAKLGNNLGIASNAIDIVKQVMQRNGMDVNNLSRVLPKGASPS